MEHKVKIEEWVERFRAIGLDDAAMQSWHKLFERENPEGHQSFLEWLGLPAEKITEIRQKFALRPLRPRCNIGGVHSLTGREDDNVSNY